MFEAVWFLLIGGLLIFMGLARSVIAGLPMTGAMVYLAFGFIIGPAGLGLLNVDLYKDAHVLRLLAETGLLISLFSIGMHLRIPLGSSRWRLVLRLALPAMILTIVAMTLVGFYALGWTLGAALLAAAALAPTDPVLANELRPREAGDDEPLRFALSGEGGANDGAAYPFVLIGLAVCNLGHPDAQSPATLAASLIWGVMGAVLVGWIMGTATEALVSRLRIRYEKAMGYEGFLALGLMSACYGVALMIHGYAFLAVFAAGVALRRKEMRETGDATPQQTLDQVTHGDMHQAARHPELAHAYLAESMMTFSVELEHLVELGMMLLIGSIVSIYWRDMLQWQSLVAVLALFLVARPLSVWVSLMGTGTDRIQRLLAGWLGIRGVGTFFYLLLALENTDADNVRPIAPVLLAVIVASVFLHGISASPLLERYFRSGHKPAALPDRPKKE
ncbi:MULTISPECIES: sodium:proton antiporter [unclassified Achromobacter]|uniref:cation:proton antiporter n=1 Tax=unclassified Achromobacter TaxID=2626865 RepID=UPI000B51AE17|nr:MULTISPECIES: cation:proton antiporter [unclassified Achromobacter]OWT80479.1 sodium:proton antiporter [Achromobacter sp. HZ34]OWT82362.1 sodium:proton antiporter [Achromobacter sp. HZ28]